MASFCIGETYTREDVEKFLAGKVIRIDHDKLFIPSFVEFQYEISSAPEGKKLNENNKAHLGVIRQLQKHGIDPVSLAPLKPLHSPFIAPAKDPIRGPRVEEEVGVEVRDSSFQKGGVGENKTLKLQMEIAQAEAAWLDCLAFHGAARPILATDQTVLTRNIQQRKIEAVLLAIAGMKHEPANDGFKPSNFISLSRLFDPEKFERFVNLGAAAKNKQEAKKRADAHRLQLMTNDTPPTDDEVAHADPARVRGILAQAFSGRASGPVGA